MNLIKLQVKTALQKYSIFIGNNILGKLNTLFKENLIEFNQCLLSVDKNVPKELINKVLHSLPKKKCPFIILILVRKTKIKKILIIFYLYCFVKILTVMIVLSLLEEG